MTYLLYLFGFIPSAIWLAFYLRKDKHPEPNKMIIKIFFLGMGSALLAVFLERGIQETANLFIASFSRNSLFAIFLGGALIEEYLKYVVVKAGVFKNAELDEPTDLVLYMIISALGFAALENILVLTNYHPILTSAKAIEIMGLRFISATFLHALCSGLLGYFIALSFYNIKRQKVYFTLGLFLTVVLHGAYNWSIMNMSGASRFYLPILIIAGLGCFISFAFYRLKKSKGACLIYES